MFPSEPSFATITKTEAAVAGTDAAIGLASSQQVGSVISFTDPLLPGPASLARMVPRSDLPRQARPSGSVKRTFGAPVRFCGALSVLGVIAHAAHTARAAHIALWQRLNVPS
jgi:hypothetical protein